ncbi:MAG: Hsp20 family protein [Methylobacteriaceae bacterium]|jgi:molecular chaperone IbpA|nr:Hsp20 family protein [Methylobacteriaceae bacterium]
MRQIDFSPFYRNTVGFDRLFSVLDQMVGGVEQTPTYPPYNIERTGENNYRITLAVAGFKEGDLNIELKDNTLTIRGEKADEEKKEPSEFVFQGIAARAFERRFQIADTVIVKGASLEHGLLHIDLVREIPEAKRPRQIPIGNDAGKPELTAVAHEDATSAV